MDKVKTTAAAFGIGAVFAFGYAGGVATRPPADPPAAPYDRPGVHKPCIVPREDSEMAGWCDFVRLEGADTGTWYGR